LAGLVKPTWNLIPRVDCAGVVVAAETKGWKCWANLTRTAVPPSVCDWVMATYAVPATSAIPPAYALWFGSTLRTPPTWSQVAPLNCLTNTCSRISALANGRLDSDHTIQGTSPTLVICGEAAVSLPSMFSDG